MTKDEARARLERHLGFAWDAGTKGGKDGINHGMKLADAYAQAYTEAALADTLGMLEEIARQEWAATLETGDEEHFKVRVQQNPDRTAGGFRYWIAEPGERLGEETTRAEVLVLLKGDAE